MHPVTIPDGLADLPPGPELAALLAGLDPSRVANRDTVTVLRAWRRQRSHTDAAELAILAELGHCDPFSPAEHVARVDTVHPDCGLEIAAALTVTEVAAWRDYTLADTLVRRLPTVQASLAAGDIDRARAMVFADLLEPLTDTQNTRICVALLPHAPKLTTAQLRARLRRMVLAIDPDAARRRYQRALQQRRLVCVLDEDGTATLTASGMDPTAAQAACERVDGLARDLRAAGHPDPLPAIRVDLTSALLDGSLHTLSHDEIVAVMLARATTPDPETSDPVDSGGGPVSAAGTGTESDTNSNSGSGVSTDSHPGTGSTGVPAPDDGNHGDYPDNSGNGSGSHDGDEHGRTKTSTDDEVHGRSDSGKADGDRNSPGNTDTDGEGEGEGPGDGPGDGGGNSGSDSPGGGSGDGPRRGGPDSGGDPRGGGSGGGGAAPERARPGVEIRLRLSTLLEHDDHPGEIPGLGPIPAHTARACVTRQQHAEWRFAITDPDGYLLLAGIIRRRPPPHLRYPLIRQAHGGTVELQIPATLIEQLAVDPPAGWEPLIADLTAQYARRAALLAALDQRPTDRFPHPALRRHVEIRDRTCTFPGCRRPARKAQQDHTRDHQHGGPTTTTNLGPLCVFHHAIKTAGRWHVHQPTPGVFRWRSPLGWTYTTRGEPVCPPLPDPLPEPEPESSGPESGPWSPRQGELDEQPLRPVTPEAGEPDEPAATTTEVATTTSEPDSATIKRAPPDEPPF